MTPVTKCDREGCDHVNGTGLAFHMELAQFAIKGGGRRLLDVERSLDFCSAECVLLWAQPHANAERERDEYVSRVFADGVRS